MQTKLNKTRDTIVQFLNDNKIDFEISDCPVDSEDEAQHHNGYNLETPNVLASIIPNYNNNKVEFLVLNQNLMMHLVSEGFSDSEISNKGKIWTHIKTLSEFKKLLKASA